MEGQEGTVISWVPEFKTTASLADTISSYVPLFIYYFS